MSVAIVKSHNASFPSLKVAKRQAEREPSTIAPVTVSKRVLISSFTQHVLQASTSYHGLLNIILFCVEGKAPEIGIVAVYSANTFVPRKIIHILVSNFNNIPTKLYKEENIEIALCAETARVP